MPVYVVDTNVVVSGVLATSPTSPPPRIVDAMLDNGFDYAVSPDLLQEYADVLARPPLAGLHGLGTSEIERLVADIAANATMHEPIAGSSAPDPGDDHLWALIGALGACLVTGDALLVASPPANATVISPREFVEAVLIDAGDRQL